MGIAVPIAGFVDAGNLFGVQRLLDAKKTVHVEFLDELVELRIIKKPAHLELLRFDRHS